MMVTITGYKTKQSKEGRDFTILEITGGLEMVQSQQTGKMYATVRKSSVPTTFDEQVAKSLVGSQLPGKIVRVECDPYDYTVESSGEVVSLMHRWEYRNDESINEMELQLS